MRVQYIYSVQQNKAYTRLNIACQQSSCRAAVRHGTEHVLDAYGTVSTHLCLHFILKNHAKSNLDSNIVANLRLLKQILNHNRSKFVLSKLVLSGVCCKHFMYTCMHCSCTLSCVHVECLRPKFPQYSYKI